MFTLPEQEAASRESSKNFNMLWYHNQQQSNSANCTLDASIYKRCAEKMVNDVDVSNRLNYVYRFNNYCHALLIRIISSASRKCSSSSFECNQWARVFDDEFAGGGSVSTDIKCNVWLIDVFSARKWKNTRVDTDFGNFFCHQGRMNWNTRDHWQNQISWTTQVARSTPWSPNFITPMNRRNWSLGYDAC